MSNNNTITYEQLINLSMDEFNALKNKDILEYLLYMYNFNRKYGLENFKIKMKHLYRACLDMDRVLLPVSMALEEVIKGTDCEDCKNSLIEFQQEFFDTSLKVENPLKYWSDNEATVKALFGVFDYYFPIFEMFEDLDYDLGRLMVIYEVEED